LALLLFASIIAGAGKGEGVGFLPPPPLQELLPAE
jgi:hypothetical protein